MSEGRCKKERYNPLGERLAFCGAAVWWLRSPYLNNSNNAWNVNSDGSSNNNNCSNSNGVRPALTGLRDE